MYKNLTTLLRAAAIFSLLCPFLGFSNDGSDITISGESPRHGIGSSLYKASSRDGDVTSCTWSITDVVKDDPTFTGALAEIEKHGEDCYLKFNDFGSVILRCTAAVDIKGSIKHQSGSKRIECQMIPPTTTPTLSITGESVVTLNSEHEYIAEYSTPKIASNITWTYPVNQTHTDEKVTIGFTDLGSFRLNCELGYTVEGQQQEPVRKHKDIRVLPRVELTAMRASYENSNVANIPGEGIVKIHYNIDDDDESYEDGDKYMGADCLQTSFKENNTNPDDDLCKLEISFGNDVSINDLTEGTLYIEVTEGLRLWTNNMRTEDDDIFLGKINTDGQIELSVALSLAVPEDKAKVRDILNNGLYVEGVAHGYGCIKIRFADKKLKLPYQCYAVGGPENQPDPTLRKSFKKQNSFPNLVDCEWCIKEFSNTDYLHSYNCIAYAVDPKREIFNGTASYSLPFKGAFWVNKNGNELEVPSFDSWSESNWRNDPFMYIFPITLDAWNNSLKPKFKEKFNNSSITPYQDNDEDDEVYYRGGYSSAFRQLLEDVIREQPGLLLLGMRITTMAIFNRGSDDDDIDNFFKLTDFVASSANNKQFKECGVNDDNRVIIYYHDYHAARVLKHAPGCKDFDKNADPEWKIAVSKSADRSQLLIHREEQITSKFGEVDRAYKYKLD